MPSTQALGALLLLISGFILGLAFDLYRVLRRLSNPGRWLTVACDLVFWLAYTVWTFILLVRVNAGEVRFYVFISIATGAAIYFWRFSRSMTKAWYILLYRLVLMLSWMTSLINRILDVLTRIVLWPYHLFLNYLIRPIWHVACFLLNPFFVMWRWMRRLLVNGCGWLTRPFRRLWRRVRQAIANWLVPPTKDS